jgi:hypothetical protein
MLGTGRKNAEYAKNLKNIPALGAMDGAVTIPVHQRWTGCSFAKQNCVPKIRHGWRILGTLGTVFAAPRRQSKQGLPDLV